MTATAEPEVRGDRVAQRLDRPRLVADGTARLDERQREVVEHRQGHLLVLGGPGTGKTTTLVQMLAERLRCQAGASAARMVALAHDRAGAARLARLVGHALGSGQLPLVGTFHSLALGLVRAMADPQVPGSAPRLLPAAEQEARLRELLAWSIREGRVAWPAELTPALSTRGIVEQVRTLLARARMLGLEGADLARFGRRDGVAAWVALGDFMTEYLDVLALDGALDYSELLQAACAGLAGSGTHGRSPFDLVVVDELEDADPGQVRLLQVLAARGSQVIGFADPDQAIHGFRGATRRIVSDFPDLFPAADGARARLVVLGQGYRTSGVVADALRGVLPTPALAPIPAHQQREHRLPRHSGRMGRVDALTYPGGPSQAAGIARLLLAAHAGLDRDRPIPWSQMAVVVRSPTRQGHRLASGMREAGIPCSWADGSVPLAGEAIVIQIFDILRLALGEPVAATAGADLLGGHVGGLDPLGARQVATALVSGSGDAGAPSTSAALALGEALAAGRVPLGCALSEPLAAGFGRVTAAIAAARDALGRQEVVAEVLWAAWSASDTPQRLRAAALAEPGSAPDRALDCAVELFERANRLSPRLRGAVGVRAFMAATAAESLSRSGRTRVRDEVTLLSAHAAKGREWELVVLAGVQEGVWPGVRARGDILGVSELGAEGRVAAATFAELVDAERRLFYVAGSRARSALVVTAVDEGRPGGLIPSRFVRELGTHVVAGGSAAASSVCSEAELVVQLRRAAALGLGSRPARTALDRALGEASVDRLARLAGRPGSPADPRSWWYSAAPALSAPDGGKGLDRGSCEQEPVRLAASGIGALLACPLRWFLEKRAGVAQAPAAAASVGVLLHALAEAVTSGEIPATGQAVDEVIDIAWAEVPLAAEYLREPGRQRARLMARTFLNWHTTSPRRPVAVEVPLACTVQTAEGPAHLTGKIDRVDVGPGGELHLVDLKTGRTAASSAQAAAHPQLAAYQVAFREGAVRWAPEGSGTGTLMGAELVHIGDAFASGQPKVRHQAALQDGAPWALDLLAAAVRAARGPDYPARPGPSCRTCSFRALCPARPGLDVAEVACDG